jgi:DNA-binding MarR family transcriptional regulator
MPPTSTGAETAANEHENRLEHALWQLSRTMVKVLDDELGPLRLTITQFGTLNRLVVYGPMSTADLARNFGLRPQTIAQAVTALLDAGFVQRRHHPVHKRVLLIELTDVGRRAWEDGDRRVASVENRIRDSLGERAYRAMHRDTWKIIEAFGGLPDEASAGPLWPVPQRGDRLNRGGPA